MSFRPLPSRRQALVACALVFLVLLTCAALMSAAVLVPAPPAVVPFIVTIAIGCPMLAALQLPGSIAVLRSGRPGRLRANDARLVAEMRHFLRQLPETRHPLDR